MQSTKTGRMKPCKRCGTEFYCLACREAGSRHGESKYCSMACAHAARSEVPNAERLWRSVVKGERCWLWTASTNDDGYGHFRSIEGKYVNAHRFSYRLHKGEIPAGMTVMHSCDQRHCVNPDHLSLGTHAENMADMARKGRGTAGEKSVKAKLTLAQVQEIRANPPKFGRGKTETEEYAKRYGVSVGAIYSIVRGDSWRTI